MIMAHEARSVVKTHIQVEERPSVQLTRRIEDLIVREALRGKNSAWFFVWQDEAEDVHGLLSAHCYYVTVTNEADGGQSIVYVNWEEGYKPPK